MKDLNTLHIKRNDLLQKRADALEAATKKYTAGDMTGYSADMEKVKGFNGELETLAGLITETEKSFGVKDFVPAGEGAQRAAKAGKALVDSIRGTEQYESAWLESVRTGVTIDKGFGIQSLAPLYEVEKALKAMTIGGGDPAGSDGGFMVPIDFDNRVIELMKEYIDLSTLVTVEHVNVNSGWRVLDTTGTRTALTKMDEMGRLTEGQKPKMKRIDYSCSKFGDKLIVSNELMADAKGLIAYLAEWWAPKYVMTKNSLILGLLDSLAFSPLAGTTDAEQIKAMKSLLNTGLNTAHSKGATILTNSFGYDIMDGWADSTGRPMLVPDPKGGDFSRFKARKVLYGDPDLIPDVTVDGAAYHPIYAGNFKAAIRMFLRNGTRIRSTDIGGDAWDTDSTEIRCICRMDAKSVDGAAVKRTGVLSAEAAAAAAAASEE